MKYLVKWKDLNYDECTWEFVDDPLMNGKSLESHVKKFHFYDDYDRACDEVFLFRLFIVHFSSSLSRTLN